MLVEGTNFQVLESVEADFDAMTWSFRLQGHHRVSGGHYGVVHVAVLVKVNSKLDHATRLLRHLREVVTEPHEKEKIDSFFDPEPL